MQNNYGGGYPAASPAYGYSGASSYGPGPGKSYGVGTVAAAAVGGMVVGAGTYYMFSRMSRATCSGYDCCYSCDNSCYSHGRSSCDMQFDRTLYRDDIMKSGTGFYPNDYMTPLMLRVSAVSGAGYNVTSVCPPPDWNGSQPYTNSNDLFVTLTKMEELGDVDDDGGLVANRAQSTQGIGVTMLGLLLVARLSARPRV